MQLHAPVKSYFQCHLKYHSYSASLFFLYRHLCPPRAVPRPSTATYLVQPSARATRALLGRCTLYPTTKPSPHPPTATLLPQNPRRASQLVASPIATRALHLLDPPSLQPTLAAPLLFSLLLLLHTLPRFPLQQIRWGCR